MFLVILIIFVIKAVKYYIIPSSSPFSVGRERNDRKILSARGFLVLSTPSLSYSFSFYFRRFVRRKQTPHSLQACTKVWKLSLMEGEKSSLMFFLLQIIIMGFSTSLYSGSDMNIYYNTCECSEGKEKSSYTHYHLFTAFILCCLGIYWIFYCSSPGHFFPTTLSDNISGLIIIFTRLSV